MHASPGFSLLEMLVTLGVAAVLAALAVPSFQTVMLNSQRTAAVNGFFHAIFLARSAAVMRVQIVSICRSDDGQNCSRTSPWEAGWIVFVNRDRDEPPERDEGEEVLMTNEGWNNGTVSSNRGAYSFRPHSQSVVNGTVIFCDRRGPEHARAIIISQTGRPRVAQRDASGRPLRCPAG